MPTPTPPATMTQQSEHMIPGFGKQIPFEAINEPGCYICTWSGHLLRVPEDSIKPGRSPMLDLVGTTPLFVTKISNDPFVPASKARLLAAQCDVQVNF